MFTLINNKLFMKKNILFWGGGLKAKMYAHLLCNNKGLKKKYQLKYIFDPSIKKINFKTSAEFSNNKNFIIKNYKKISYFLVCVGNDYGFARYEISKKLEKLGLKPLHIKFKSSHLDSSAVVGKGVQILPHAVVNANVVLGDYCIVNTNSTVEHDCQIGNGVHIMPGAVVLGNVKIGNYVTIGANSTILPGITISNNVVVGAGSVVIKNILNDQIVVGNPAKFLKKLKKNIIY